MRIALVALKNNELCGGGCNELRSHTVGNPIFTAHKFAAKYAIPWQWDWLMSKIPSQRRAVSEGGGQGGGGPSERRRRYDPRGPDEDVIGGETMFPLPLLNEALSTCVTSGFANRTRDLIDKGAVGSPADLGAAAAAGKHSLANTLAEAGADPPTALTVYCKMCMHKYQFFFQKVFARNPT